MNLHLISQDEHNNYDTHPSLILDEQYIKGIKENFWMCDVWASTPENAKCEFLGKARDGMEKGVICSPFNAG